MLLVALAAALWPAGAFADTITVQNLHDSGQGSLRQAISDAPAGSTINVPAGTITLTTGVLEVDKSLTINGAGTTSTIVSGGGASGVFHVDGSGTAVTIDQLTIRDGLLRNPGGLARGAGLFVEFGSSAVLDHMLFTNNVVDTSATSGAGGTSFGGAIANLGDLTITNTAVVGNKALSDGAPGASGADASGAGIYSTTSGNVLIQRSNVSGNTAQALGGGGPPKGNNKGGSVSGAGIYLSASGSGTATITESTVSGNSGDASDGPGATDSGSVQGVGIFASLSSGNLGLTNDTIAANTGTANGEFGVDEGAGLFVSPLMSGTTTVSSSTITRNSLTLGHMTQGGNLWVGNSNHVKLLSTIVSQGVSAPGSENCSFAPTSLGHNIEDLNECGLSAAGDRPNTDPRLGPLQDNGGPAPTIGFGADSPAFNGGDPVTCPSTDERGIGRPQGAACDVGAFELGLADLGLRASTSDEKLSLGHTVTLALAGSNGGSGVGHGTTIGAKLPAGLAFVSATPSAGSCIGTTTISCTIGELGAGAAAGAQIVARAIKPGAQATSASIGSSTLDLSAANNSASVSVTVNRLGMAKAGLSRKTFRLGSKLPKLSKVRTGTTIRFTLPEAARVKLSFARKRGRRFRSAGSFTVRAHAGANKLRFQGRLSRRKKLKPGRYQLTLRATDQFGNRSAAKKLTFRLLP